MGRATSEGVRSAARYTRDLLKPSPEIEQCEIPKGRRNQRNSERQGVVAKSSRQSNRRKIEQVHKARIEAEIAVELQRLSCYGRCLIDCSGRRQQQNIDLCEDAVGGTAALRQVVLSSIGVECAIPAGSLEDRTYEREQRIRVLVQQSLSGI